METNSNQSYCIQGFYCGKLDRSFIGLKYPWWAKVLLFLGIDKRKNKWRIIQECNYTKTFRYVGEGIFNAGKDYGEGREKGIIQLQVNGIGEERAYKITPNHRELVDTDWAKNFLNNERIVNARIK